MSENTMNNLKIGVDVGGTKIEAVLVDAMGTVLGSARIPARHGNDAVIEDIVAVAHQAAGERFDEVRAIGVGTPGTVDSASGHVGNIVNLDVVSLDMGPLISQRSGVPAHVENDVNAAAVGAATVLGGADGMAGTIAFLNFGTGLAAGIVENGVLMHGYRCGRRNRPYPSRTSSPQVPLRAIRMLGNRLIGRIRGTSVAQRRPADARPDSSREKAGGRGRRCAGHGSARHRRHYPDFGPIR